jgi:transposase
MYYGGIDLHSNNNRIGIIDELGKKLYLRTMPNNLTWVRKALDPFRAELHGVVVESTYNWYWLVDGLQASGYHVHLANTTASRQYSGLKHTDDGTDACWLADLLRLGVLKEGYIYPQKQRGIRDLLRKRGQLVQQRTRNILSMENLISRNCGLRLNSNAIKSLTAEEVNKAFVDTNVALALTSTLGVVRALTHEIKVVEKQVKQQVKMLEPYHLLKTVSGIGEILAMTIMLEAAEMSRFPTVGDFCSYCRCVDSVRLSNGKKKGSGNRKNGNKYLSWAFIEAANFAIRSDSTIRRFYQRKKARTKSVVARKAVAHKLARACYYVLRDRMPFAVAKCFGP